MIILLNLSRNSRKSASMKLKAALGNQGIDLSTRTIRRRFFEAGNKAYRPKKKPKLTDIRRQRLTLVKSFKTWIVDAGKRVNIFLLSHKDIYHLPVINSIVFKRFGPCQSLPFSWLQSTLVTSLDDRPCNQPQKVFCGWFMYSK